MNLAPCRVRKALFTSLNCWQHAAVFATRAACAAPRVRWVITASDWSLINGKMDFGIATVAVITRRIFCVLHHKYTQLCPSYDLSPLKSAHRSSGERRSRWPSKKDFTSLVAVFLLRGGKQPWNAEQRALIARTHPQRWRSRVGGWKTLRLSCLDAGIRLKWPRGSV